MRQHCRPHGHRHPGPPHNFQGDGVKTRLHVHAGRLGGGSVEGTEEGCQETAVWEQGQERTSGQQLRSQRKALGLDAGGKKVLEEMKEQSRPSVPVLGQSLPFLHDKQTQNNPQRARSVRHIAGTEGRAGCGGAAGPGQLALCRAAQKMRVPVLGNLRPLEPGVPGLGVSYCSLSSLCRSPSKRGWLGHPPQLPPGATHPWRSTVCSASVLRRKWGGAAGSRGGPGPVGRQGRLR